MPEIDPVILQLRADMAKYQSDLRQSAARTSADLDRMDRSVVSLETQMQKSFRGMGQSANKAQLLVGSSLGALKSVIAGVSAVALAQSFLKIADESKKLDAQLRLATQGFGSFGQAQEDVRRIADETRSGLSETASLYGNFVRGAKELGATQAEAARATETFSKTLKISGADANQAASATLQFGQALAAGALRGDELNSILEASPRLARLLAEAMGRPIGEIKKLGEEGKLTSDKLLRALTDTKFTAGIDAEFKQIPVTFDEAMTRVYNAAVVTFGAFDRGGEFSTALSNFVGDGADGFADLESRAEQFGIEVRSTLAGLGDAFNPLLEAGNSVFDALGLKGFDPQGFIRQSLREFDAIANYLADTPVGRLVGAGRSNSLGAYDKGRNADKTRREGEASERRSRNMIGGYDVMGNPLPGTPAAGRGTAPRPTTTDSGGKKKPKAEPKSKLNPEAFAREEAALNDRILRYKGEEVVSLTERAAIDLSRIEAAREVANKEVATDERFTAAQKEKLIALANQVAAMQAVAVIAERDKALAEQVAEARRGNERYKRDALEAQAQGADTREARLAAERRILAFLEQQERAELEAAIQAGKIADANKARADLATAQGARRGATERDNEGPLSSYARSLTATSFKDQAEQLVVNELQSVQDGITDALAGALGTKNSLIKGLIGMFVQNVIMAPIAQALAGMSGGGGGGGFLGSLIGGLGSILGLGGGGSIGGMPSPFGPSIGWNRKPNPAGTLSLFGRASGGYVAPGQLVRVNEGASPGRVEGFIPSGSGHIVPLGRMNVAGRGGNTTIVQNFTLDARHGITTPELLNAVNSQIKSEAGKAAGSAYAASQQSVPGTLNKYNQLNG